ncbi:hypothetical protein LMG1866_05175 [Achromobacter ruhlandii]|nr:hypothetical protein LMG1866_05175 [Achromobacter ruhlandii]CUJ42287.1 Uncharacterised protein [Achromobacter xylosoxidans]CUR74523.1 hypothetical protein BN2905_35010 [Achromobacter xylosoxidans]
MDLDFPVRRKVIFEINFRTNVRIMRILNGMRFRIVMTRK